MQQSAGSARVARLEEVEPIQVAGVLYQPLRHVLGVRAFGINAYTARSPGDLLIEPHDELGPGSGHHEEAYVVVSGRARFTVNGQEIDAPAGTVVFVADLAATRSAIAVEPGTTTLVVGGPADRPVPVSPFEYWFRAEEPCCRGDYQTAIDIATEGLEPWPNHPILNYQLACYHARADQFKEALGRLARAIAADPNARRWAVEDSDFDSLREDKRFTNLTRE